MLEDEFISNLYYMNDEGYFDSLDSEENPVELYNNALYELENNSNDYFEFKNEFYEVQKRLTLEGNIVISVGLFGHSGDNEVWTEGTKEMLDDMHKAKIDMADEIFVINVDDYIGTSTKSEIEYAKAHNKKINYLVEHKEDK